MNQDAHIPIPLSLVWKDGLDEKIDVESIEMTRRDLMMKLCDGDEFVLNSLSYHNYDRLAQVSKHLQLQRQDFLKRRRNDGEFALYWICKNNNPILDQFFEKTFFHKQDFFMMYNNETPFQLLYQSNSPYLKPCIQNLEISPSDLPLEFQIPVEMFAINDSDNNPKEFDQSHHILPKKRKQPISRYKVVEVIGEGSFGVVYKAIDKQNKNSIVAIKKVRQNPKFKSREYSIAKKVKYHPNVISIQDAYFSKSFDTYDKKTQIYFLHFVFDCIDFNLSDILGIFLERKLE